MLAQPWLLDLSPGQRRQRELLLDSALSNSDVAVVNASITTVAELGLRALLVAHLVESRSPQTSCVILAALGPLAQAEDVDTAIGLAQQDPLCFGAPLRSFLSDAHRHGAFVKNEHIAAMLEQFDCHQAWQGEEFVRLTYIARDGLMEQLDALDVSDQRWIRRVNILACSSAVVAAQILQRLIALTDDTHIASAAIAAAGRSLDFCDEESLLRWLPKIPDSVVPVLRCKGGKASIAALRMVVRDPLTSGQQRAKALDGLCSIDLDRANLQHELAAAWGPYEAGLFRIPLQRNIHFADVVAAHAWKDAKDREIDLDTQLKIYCDSGDISFLAQVRDLFRQIYRGHVRSALQGNFAIKRQALPDLEQRIFQYGRHLVQSGRSVRPWISVHPETGRDLLLRFICEWLQENPSDAIKVALLESAARHEPDGHHLRILGAYWRRGNPSVRRAAVEVLVSAGEKSRGLELSLAKLAAETTEPRLQTQALAALRTLGASWAEPIVRAALTSRHSNNADNEVQTISTMAVKHEAADTLAVIGNAASIATLVYWLSAHDSNAFRQRLKIALRHCAGPVYALVLIHALHKNSIDDNKPRTTRLLHDALSGHLSLGVAMRLARSTEPAHQALVAACLDNSVTLADASCHKFTEALHRAQVLPAATVIDPARTLRLHGFHPDAARLFVADFQTDIGQTDKLTIVRQQLASWITWLGAGPFAAALNIVLQAADKTHYEQTTTLLDLLERDITTLEPNIVANFIQRCVAGAPMSSAVMRSIAIVRTLPHSALIGGLRRYQLLGQLGALRTIADVKHCLIGCKIGTDVASDSASLLHEALQVPRSRDGITAELEHLHDHISRWYRTADIEAPWLTEAIKQRPIGLPIIVRTEVKKHRDGWIRSHDSLVTLQLLLDHDDPAERQTAADRLLKWPDAAQAHPRILDAYMSGRIDIELTQNHIVVAALRGWPYSSPQQSLARQLIVAKLLAEYQLAEVVPSWIVARMHGDRDSDNLLRAIDPWKLESIIVERARAGHFDAVELLHNGPLRCELVALAQQHSVNLNHLLHETNTAPTEQPDNREDPEDPLAEKTVSQLVEIANQKSAAKPSSEANGQTWSEPANAGERGRGSHGLSVRAIHALARHGETAREPLTALTVDRRPAVRSAALRALRLVATKEHMMEVTVRVLEVESRSDVIVSLLRSIGHGRHPPTLSALLDRITDNDNKIREAAHQSLQSWGSSALPAIHQQARRARPDRRHIFEALIAEMR
jgi:hypothetical protein